MLHFVSVGGYGWTGSSACIDILKEFEGFGDLNGEFRIIKDPYGISDLEHSLVDSWDFVRHDIAIQDFLNYTNNINGLSDVKCLRGTTLYISSPFSVQYVYTQYS